MASVLTTPRDVTCPQNLMLYNKGVWKPRRTISLLTCCRNRCRSAPQNFFLRQKSLHELNLLIY